MSSSIVQIHDKRFRVFITGRQIRKAVKRLGQEITHDFHGKDVVLLAILNGSFMFAADLVRAIDLPGQEITFLRLSSYEGTTSTGTTHTLLGLNSDLRGKSVIVLEDIIDTGLTMDVIVKQLEAMGCSTIRIATLLLKPAAYKGTRAIHYVGFEIPNDFVVGYGLDYNGHGRNLKDLYHIVS